MEITHFWTRPRTSGMPSNRNAPCSIGVNESTFPTVFADHAYWAKVRSEKNPADIIEVVECQEKRKRLEFCEGNLISSVGF